MRIIWLEYNEYDAFFPIASFWVNSTGCSGEFHVVYLTIWRSKKKHFEQFQRKSATVGSFYHKTVSQVLE